MEVEEVRRESFLEATHPPHISGRRSERRRGGVQSHKENTRLRELYEWWMSLWCDGVDIQRALRGLRRMEPE